MAAAARGVRLGSNLLWLLIISKYAANQCPLAIDLNPCAERKSEAAPEIRVVPPPKWYMYLRN